MSRRRKAVKRDPAKPKPTAEQVRKLTSKNIKRIKDFTKSEGDGKYSTGLIVPKGGSFKKWHTHLKDFRKKNPKMSYREAQKKASKSYKS